MKTKRNEHLSNGKTMCKRKEKLETKKRTGGRNKLVCKVVSFCETSVSVGVNKG